MDRMRKDIYICPNNEPALIRILEELNEYNPNVIATSETSVYVNFTKLPLGLTHKLRISNHDSKKHCYKWELRVNENSVKEKCPDSFYFHDVDDFIEAFQDYYDHMEIL